MASSSKSLKSLSETALLSMAQLTAGGGAGLLLAGAIGRKAQRITALALLGVSVAAAIPALVDKIVWDRRNSQSERGLQRRLDRIRRGTSFADDTELY